MITRNRRAGRAAIACACCLGLVGASHADDMYEGFVYAPNTPINGLLGGVGWSSAWMADGPGANTGMVTLSHASALPPSGVDCRTNLDTILTREFKPSSISPGGRAWMSWLYERDNNLLAVVRMYGTAVDPVQVTLKPSGEVVLRYGGGAPVTAAKKTAGPFGTDFFLLRLREDLGGGHIDLWVSPLGTLGAPDASVPAPPNVNYATFECFMSIAQTLDELRTGETLGSVSTLAGPCPADCDGSGALDIDDFICFQTLFGLGDGGADCDGSGELDIDDFICFQTEFGLGCP